YATAGTATNNGTITMTAKKAKGLVTNKNGNSFGKIVNKGNISVNGDEVVAVAALAGTVETETGTIKVEGASGIGVYTDGGTIEAKSGTIEARNGAINVYADKGTI
ncbi:hypothetical protein, partial [Fusobacterium necrophorum]|uniref:hypothetical protein n=1 Tax=Fusobacterium necrophorum TaxID=859 RepID=UPI00056458E6